MIEPSIVRSSTISTSFTRVGSRNGVVDRCPKLRSCRNASTVNSWSTYYSAGRADVKPRPPLASIPLSSILRTYFTMSISCSPFLLASSTQVLQRMLRAKSGILDIDSNPVLRWMLKRTFYRQFCAGESQDEVLRTVKDFHAAGSGVILEYAKEVLESAGVTQSASEIRSNIEQWKSGVLQTISMAADGDMVALK